MATKTKTRKASTTKTTKAASKPSKPAAKPVATVEHVEKLKQPAGERPVSPRMVAIHHEHDFLMGLAAGSKTDVAAITKYVADKLVSVNGCKRDYAEKLAASALNHQLPIDAGVGRQNSKIRTNAKREGNRIVFDAKSKIEWVGGTIRRRQSA